MYKFILQNPKLTILAASVIGLTAGHLVGRYRSSPYTSQYLTPYESQDQVFHILDTTNKPVVLYYHRGLHAVDRLVRRELLKNSTLYHDRAIWMIVSYKQHAAHINTNIENVSNNHISLQIRYPKRKHFVRTEDGVNHESEDYFSVFFEGKSDTRQVKHFLEKYAVSEVNDAMQPLREVAQETLFNKVFTK